MQLLRILMPQDLIGWLGSGVLLVALIVQIGPELRTVHGGGVLVVLLSGLALLVWKLPAKVGTWWELRGAGLRCVVLGATAYALIVGLGFVNDIRSPRAMWELLTVTGGAPYSFTHTLALCGAGLAVWTQFNRHGPSSEEALKETHVRGAKLISFEQARQTAASKRTAEDRCLFWGGLELPLKCGTEHFCVVGESGSGKTKTIHLLLKSVLPTIEPGSNCRAVLFDAKGDLFSVLSALKLKCPVMTLHPFDRRGVAWDIAADVKDPMVAIEVATILIPEKSDDREPYFPNAARALLSGVMESFLRTAPGKWTLRDVVLALRYPERTRALLRTCKEARYLVSKYANETRTASDIASTVENSMRRLSFVAAAWEHATERISLEDWVANQESVLLLGRSPQMESTLAELNRAMLFRLAQLIRSQSEAVRDPSGKPPRQTWIVVDELRDAGRLDGFNSLLVEGRSKGACVVLGFQDIPGLHTVYGANLANELVGLCANKAFLRTGDSTTQSFASDCFGHQDIELPRFSVTEGVQQTSSAQGRSSTVSSSTQYSQQRLSRPLILASQFRDDLPRPSRETGVSGYYLTATVHHPYFANLSGDFIEQALPAINYVALAEEQRDFLPRGAAGDETFTLKEWAEADLRRLNLEGHPELLETDADKADPPSAEPWRNLLLDREP